MRSFAGLGGSRTHGQGWKRDYGLLVVTGGQREGPGDCSSGPGAWRGALQDYALLALLVILSP